MILIPRRRDTFSCKDYHSNNKENSKWWQSPRIINSEYGKEEISFTSSPMLKKGIASDTKENQPVNNYSKRQLKRKHTQTENIQNVLTIKEENLSSPNTPPKTVLHTPEIRTAKRRAIPRVSIPVFGTTPKVFEEISMTLSEITLESSYANPNTINQLPNEIITVIFNYLNDYKDLLSVSCVSQRYNVLGCDGNLWKSMYEYYYGDRYEIEKTMRSWKFNFLERRRELLTQSDHKSYTRKKKRQVPNFNDDIVSVPDRMTPNPPSRENDASSLIQITPSSCWDDPEPHVIDFLLQKKQFFDSLESVCLVTVTPCKKSRKRL